MLRIGQNKAKNIWRFGENFVSLQMELITIFKFRKLIKYNVTT